MVLGRRTRVTKLLYNRVQTSDGQYFDRLGSME